MASVKKKIEVSPGIESLVPYPPGKPIEELERELGISDSIKIASNENPLGPSPKAVEALKDAFGDLNRYPDGSNYYLKEKLSLMLGVSTEEIIFGNGSNEIIELLMRTFLNKSTDEVLYCDPSFAVYPLVAQASGAKAVKVPLKDLTFDMEGLTNAISENTKLIFIANPNNPTGTIVGKKELDDFIESVPENIIVCLDEAYFEYATDKDYPDGVEYVKDGRNNIIVLRTFSKIYGLAGLRIGYGIASKVIVNYLDRVRQPFNVNSLAQAAALGALDDTAHLEASKKCNSDGLGYLYGELDKLNLEFVKTDANFFLIKVGDGKAVYDNLLKQGIIVRPMASYNMNEYIRITVGTASENERFIEALAEIVKASNI